jgi:fumarate hydratase subunit alpha
MMDVPAKEEKVREIGVQLIIDHVRQLCIDANCHLRDDTLCALRQAVKTEESPLGKEVLKQLLQNAEVAQSENMPFCQDTGYAVLFVEIGQDVHIVGGALAEALHEGVRQGYEQGYLRKSLVESPIRRKNTGDNTPATVHYDIVPGDRLRISLLVKGAGCDNVSALCMFTPAEGLQAAKQFIVETIERAGPNASPPVTIGVGMGGPFAQAALLAQKALLWPLGKPNPDSELARLEEELLKQINDLGIGPAGFGGTTTALGLHIESSATHIASFPVAVNVDCHSHRGKEVVI